MSYTERIRKNTEEIVDSFTGCMSKELDLIKDLQSELCDCRNELCLKCGKYREREDGKSRCEWLECRWL